MLHVLDLYYKVAIFQLALEACTSHVVDWYYKVAIFELELEACTSCTRPEVSLKSVSQFRSVAQKCRSEVSMSSVDQSIQECWSAVLLKLSIRSVNQKCGSKVSLKRVAQKCWSKVWFRSADQVSLRKFAQKCQF